MSEYFRAERTGGGLLLAIGALALLVSFVVWAGAGAQRAIAWPLAIFGLVELAVGGAVFLGTGDRVRRLRRTFASAPAAAHTEELRRMQRVTASFRIFLAAEVALLAAGLLMLVAGASHPDVHAVGAGCALQGALLLVFDVAAERRARGYLGWLRQTARSQSRVGSSAPA